MRGVFTLGYRIEDGGDWEEGLTLLGVLSRHVTAHFNLHCAALWTRRRSEPHRFGNIQGTWRQPETSEQQTHPAAGPVPDGTLRMNRDQHPVLNNFKATPPPTSRLTLELAVATCSKSVLAGSVRSASGEQTLPRVPASGPRTYHPCVVCTVQTTSKVQTIVETRRVRPGAGSCPGSVII